MYDYDTKIARYKEHIKKLEELKNYKNAEELIEKLDQEKAQVEESLSAGESSDEILNKYAELQRLSEEAMRRWEEAQMQYETLNEQFK